MSDKWTAAEIPDQTGRKVIVTGANSGLGYETALALAAHGADVTMAVRDTAKGDAAAQQIHHGHATAAGVPVPAPVGGRRGGAAGP